MKPSTLTMATLVMLAILGLAVTAAAHVPPPPITYTPENPSACDEVGISFEDPFPVWGWADYLLTFGDGTKALVNASCSGPWWDRECEGTTAHQYTDPGTYTMRLYKWVPAYKHGSHWHEGYPDGQVDGPVVVEVSPCPEIKPAGSSPFTEGACVEMLNDPTPLTGISLEGLPMLANLRNTEVRATVTGQRFDCARLKCYSGEPSFDETCENVEYYNLAQVGPLTYGSGSVVLSAHVPVVMCRLDVVKDSHEGVLPVHIRITDSHGTVGNDPETEGVDGDITTTDQVFSYTFRLPDDFGSCRPRIPT